MRNSASVICNLIVPGSGLVLLRREWLGLAAAGLFGVLGNIAVVGLLILPAAIPAWVTTSCVTGALVVWIGSQWQLWVRMRIVARPGIARELCELRDRAAAAAQSGDYPKAIAILRIALTLDDEDIATNVQWAELMTLMGKFGKAERAWRRVQHLDGDHQYERAAKEALAALPCS